MEDQLRFPDQLLRRRPQRIGSVTSIFCLSPDDCWIEAIVHTSSLIMVGGERSGLPDLQSIECEGMALAPVAAQPSGARSSSPPSASSAMSDVDGHALFHCVQAPMAKSRSTMQRGASRNTARAHAKMAAALRRQVKVSRGKAAASRAVAAASRAEAAVLAPGSPPAEGRKFDAELAEKLAGIAEREAKTSEAEAKTADSRAAKAKTRAEEAEIRRRGPVAR